MFIVKPNTWFKEGSVVELVEDLRDESHNYNYGIFEGIYIVGSCNRDGYDKFWYEQNFVNDDEVLMRELCNFDELESI